MQAPGADRHRLYGNIFKYVVCTGLNQVTNKRRELHESVCMCLHVCVLLSLVGTCYAGTWRAADGFLEMIVHIRTEGD